MRAAPSRACRRASYHGLLVAAARPPAERRSSSAPLAIRIVRDADAGARRDALPRRNGRATGFSFPRALQAGRRVPVWTFAMGDALLEKRVWMEYGENATYVRYALVRGLLPLALYRAAFRLPRLSRDLDPRTGALRSTPVPGGVRITARRRPRLLDSLPARRPSNIRVVSGRRIRSRARARSRRPRQHVHAADFSASLGPATPSRSRRADRSPGMRRTWVARPGGAEIVRANAPGYQRSSSRPIHSS